MKFAPILIAVSVSLLVASVSAPGGAPGRGGERPPEREVRAVWLTTVAGLDWPSTLDTAGQKASLAGAVDRLHRSGFNTIFFQVRGRGDACYRSRLEPWSEVLTGRPGGDPGWDPLDLVISEAHRRGMEVHAWFNTYFVRGGTSPAARTSPPHVMSAHPGWVKFHEDRWWLDPGEPLVDDYLAEIIRDVVARYDLDGLQLDYIRYPGRDFDDAGTYARHGGGAPKDAWRRGNITRFLSRVRSLLRSTRPHLKLGVAPIGIYRNPHGVRGLESYSDVYQDTYHWLELGLVDYVVPQLYWPMGGGGGDPDFALLADEWREQTAGSHLYLGIGSYKDEVLAQTERLVAAARASGAEGQAFFRYASISASLPFTAYGAPVLPPAMAWKDSVPPPPPAAAVDSGDGAVRRISWTPPAGGDEEGGRYAVYRMTGEEREGTVGERLVAVVPGTVTGVTDTVAAGGAGEWYAVTRVDRGWNESPPVRAVRPGEGAALAQGASGTGPVPAARRGILLVGTPWADVSSGMLFVPLRLDEGARVGVDVRAAGDAFPRRSGAAAGRPGGQVVVIDIRGIGEGGYVLTVSAGADVVERPVSVGR